MPYKHSFVRSTGNGRSLMKFFPKLAASFNSSLLKYL